jgi:hypothetical protein
MKAKIISLVKSRIVSIKIGASYASFETNFAKELNLAEDYIGRRSHGVVVLFSHCRWQENMFSVGMLSSLFPEQII